MQRKGITKSQLLRKYLHFLYKAEFKIIRVQQWHRKGRKF